MLPSFIIILGKGHQNLIVKSKLFSCSGLVIFKGSSQVIFSCIKHGMYFMKNYEIDSCQVKLIMCFRISLQTTTQFDSIKVVKIRIDIVGQISLICNCLKKNCF